MTKAVEEKNKALVLEAFDTLFNQRDYETAARYLVAELHIQHSAHIPPGRDGLFNLIRERWREPAEMIDHLLFR
jgi:predicted SnoaL-like aldol condensation-catalyzing enzyme